MGARAVYKYWLTKKMRDTLASWRENAQLITVKIFNNIEGKTAVETHDLRRQLLALKELCVSEGINKEKIDKILQQT